MVSAFISNLMRKRVNGLIAIFSLFCFSTQAMNVHPSSVQLGRLVMSCKGDEEELSRALVATLSKQVFSQAELSVKTPKIRDVVSVETADGLIFQYKKMECIERELSKVDVEIVKSMRSQLETMVNEHNEICRKQMKDRSQGNRIEAFDLAEITACQHTFDLSVLLGAMEAYSPHRKPDVRKRMREEFLAHQQDIRKKELILRPKTESSEAQR